MRDPTPAWAKLRAYNETWVPTGSLTDAQKIAAVDRVIFVRRFAAYIARMEVSAP